MSDVEGTQVRSSRTARDLPLRSPDERAQLPPMDRMERLMTAYAATGVSLDVHLTELRRDAFTRAGATPIASLAQVKHGQRVKMGRLLVALQRLPTAKGFAFLAVEDPAGMVNAVLAPDVYAQHRSALQGAFVWLRVCCKKIARRSTSWRSGLKPFERLHEDFCYGGSVGAFSVGSSGKDRCVFNNSLRSTSEIRATPIRQDLTFWESEAIHDNLPID